MPQDLTIRTAALPYAPTGTLVIYADEGQPPRGAGADAWTATGLDFAEVAAAAGFKGKAGQVLDIAAPRGIAAKRLLVLGAGKPDPGRPASGAAWTDRGGSLAAKLMASGTESAAVLLEGASAPPETIAQLAAGLKLRHYRFDKYKGRRSDDPSPSALAITLYVDDPTGSEAAIGQRLAAADGTILARDLINEPANLLGTVEFVERVGALAPLGVSVEVLDETALRALGMNAMLAVSQGSARPPRLAVMRWQGGGTAPPLAFLGKGVVFDSGGISIKPAANMEDMKGDMGGAAAVVGLMHALASRQSRANVIGIVGLVENMPSATAMRPGDIVRAASGTTIEIVNTDAEGRLVLADLLWYAQEKFRPALMVDLATLTGAISVALGSDHAGLFSNDDELAMKLTTAGLATGEKLWRLPLGAAYDKLIESRFADIKNSAGRPASAITAAQFLARFVGSVPWAHLDIAGVALNSPATETNAGWASGFGVTLLDRFVRDNYEQQ